MLNTMQEERKDEEAFVRVSKKATCAQTTNTTATVEIEIKQDEGTYTSSTPVATSSSAKVEEYIHVSDNIPFGGGSLDVSALKNKTFSETTGVDIPTRHQEHSKLVDRVPLGGGPTDTAALSVKTLAVTDGISGVGRHTASRSKSRVLVKKNEGIVYGVGTAGLPIYKVKPPKHSDTAAFPPSSDRVSKKQSQVGTATSTLSIAKGKQWSRKEHAWMGSQDGPTISRDKEWRNRQRTANEMKWDKTKRQWIPRGHKDEVKPRTANWNKRLSQWMKATTDNVKTGDVNDPTSMPSKESTWRIVNRTRSTQVGGSTREGVRWNKSTQQWLVLDKADSSGRRASVPQVHVSQLLSNTESGSQPLCATAPLRRNINHSKYQRSGETRASISDSLPTGGKLDAERSKMSTVYDQDNTTRPIYGSPRKQCFASQGTKGQLYVKDNLSRCVEDSLNQTNVVRTGIVWKNKQPAAAPKSSGARVTRDPERRASDSLLNSANVAAALNVGEARVFNNTPVSDKIANRGDRFLAPKVVYTNPRRGYGAHDSQVFLG